MGESTRIAGGGLIRSGGRCVGAERRGTRGWSRHVMLLVGETVAREGSWFKFMTGNET